MKIPYRKIATATLLPILAWAGLSASAGLAQTATQELRLDSADGLVATGVTAEAVTFEGVKAVRVKMGPGPAPGGGAVDRVTFALLKGTEGFSNGTIEVMLSSALAPDAPPAARGFVGLAFRVTPDQKRFEAIYLRPLNGRADDQVRRNHSTQYMSFPDYDFDRLRKDAPEKYESYVDIGPGEWIRMRIEVDGAKARLFVNDAPRPVLIVSDLKMGKDATGPIGLWIYNGTVAHFRDLRITRR
jgi:hypothetical protein